MMAEAIFVPKDAGRSCAAAVCRKDAVYKTGEWPRREYVKKIDLFAKVHELKR